MFDQKKMHILEAIVYAFAIILIMCCLYDQTSPRKFKNERVTYAQVKCHNIFVREGVLIESNTQEFIINGFNKFSYPKSVCTYKIIKIWYK